MNCSSLCSNPRYATIVSAMNAAGKISHWPLPEPERVAVLVASFPAPENPARAVHGASGKRRHQGAGRRENPAGQKIKRSHRAAAEISSIGKALRLRFSAGEGFREPIGWRRTVRDPGSGISHARQTTKNARENDKSEAARVMLDRGAAR
jgi:hypothetical protein